jgi:hypothetical protein
MNKEKKKEAFSPISTLAAHRPSISQGLLREDASKPAMTVPKFRKIL